MAPPKSARTRSVGTKLTEEEYALLEAAAAKSGLTVGEWCREELLHGASDGNSTATSAMPPDETLLAEILALRTILLNLFYDLANGDGIRPDRMQEWVDKPLPDVDDYQGPRRQEFLRQLAIATASATQAASLQWRSWRAAVGAAAATVGVVVTVSIFVLIP